MAKGNMREAVIEELSRAGVIKPERVVQDARISWNVTELRPDEQPPTKLKVYLPKPDNTPATESRRRELEIIEVLQANGVPVTRVLDSGEVQTTHGQLPWAKFEFVPGKSLDDLLMREGSSDSVEAAFYAMGQTLAQTHMIPVTESLAKAFPPNIRGHEGLEHLRKIGVSQERIDLYEKTASDALALSIGDAQPKNFVWDGKRLTLIDAEAVGVKNIFSELGNLHRRLEERLPEGPELTRWAYIQVLAGYEAKFVDALEKASNQIGQYMPDIAAEAEKRDAAAVTEIISKVNAITTQALMLKQKYDLFERYVQGLNVAAGVNFSKAFKLTGIVRRKSAVDMVTAMDALLEDPPGVSVILDQGKFGLTELLETDQMDLQGRVILKDYVVFPVVALGAEDRTRLYLAVYKKRNQRFMGLSIPATPVGDGAYRLTTLAEAKYENLAASAVLAQLKNYVGSNPELQELTDALASAIETARTKQEAISPVLDVAALVEQLGTRRALKPMLVDSG